MVSATAIAPPEERRRQQRVFGSKVVDIGIFRAPADSALFAAPSPPGHYAVAFPETCVGIRPVGASPFVTDRNVVTFYDPDDEYGRWLVDPRGDHCSWIGPSEVVAQQFARTADLAGGGAKVFGRPFGFSDAATFSRQRRLVRGLLHHRLPALLVEEEALAILDGVAGASQSASWPSAPRRRSGGRRVADRARDYLAVHYADAPELDDIAAAVGVSTYHLCRVFRARFGTTLHQYRTGLAVRDAHDQVFTSDRRLLDIALDLGFASHSHFTAAFARHFGVLPSVLRRAAATPQGPVGRP